MGKRIKFSPLRARILMMVGPVMSAIFFGFFRAVLFIMHWS